MSRLCFLLVATILVGCVPMGDGGARLRGQIVAHDKPASMCLLELRLARDERVVGRASVGEVFEETFVIAPVEDLYVVVITCVGLEGHYESSPLRLGSLEAYRQGVDLGTIRIE